jgi:hypothetical protein
MTTGQSFGYVSIDGFLSFLTDAEKGPWAALDITKYEPTEGAASSLQAGAPLRWKLRLVRPIQALLATRASKLSPKEIDEQRWDPAQDRLDNETKVFLTRADEPKKKAALLLRAELLLGKGTGQKRLPHSEEVAHGRKQGLLAQDKLKPEVTLLGLDEIFDEIAEATAALAFAIGLEPGQESGASRAKLKRERAALSGCVQAFNAVFDELEWQLAQPENTSEERNLIAGLQEPLRKMLENLPPAKTKKDDGESK